MAKTTSTGTGSKADGAWRRAIRVALLLIAGLTASAAPRFPFWAPGPPAVSGAVTRVGQVPDVDPNADDEDDDDPFPIPVFEDEKPAPVDSTAVRSGAPADSSARPDSAAMLPVTPGTAEPETLRYVPPSELGAPGGPTGANVGPVAPVKKPKQGIFGLPPIILILGLTAAHVFVVKAVTD